MSSHLPYECCHQSGFRYLCTSYASVYTMVNAMQRLTKFTLVNQPLTMTAFKKANNYTNSHAVHTLANESSISAVRTGV